MILFHRPAPEELRFRAELLSDERTMDYNRAWGGAIGFPQARWNAWYERWLGRSGGQRFYRYLTDSVTGEFVGEAAYHLDEAQGRYLADVIVHAPFRGRGYGRAGLALLCEAARMHGLTELWDELAPESSAAALFHALGFTEEGRGAQGILLRKDLRALAQRVMVIGCPGAGKSSFARALRDLSGLPLTYLDMLFHRPDRTTASREEFDTALKAVAAQPRWIIDGNYQRTLPLRFALCDTVFFFDLPTELCLEGARARVGKAREDLPWVEERFDPDFEQYIRDFPTDQRPAILELIGQYRDTKRIVTFRTRAEAEGYLRSLRRAKEED